MIKVYKEAEYKGDCSVLHVLHFVYCGVFSHTLLWASALSSHLIYGHAYVWAWSLLGE